MFGLEKTAIYAIGAGVLALAVVGAAIGLINYGQRLERCKTKTTQLKEEIAEASAWKDRQLHILAEKDAATARWELAASNFEIAFNAALLDRPEPEIITRWRDLAATVPAAVPLGNCDLAAVEAWKILNEAGITGGSFWDSTEDSPDSSYMDLEEWEQQYWEDARTQARRSTRQIFVSPVSISPYPPLVTNVPGNLNSPSQVYVFQTWNPTGP